jgi:hypothetical protein
MNDYNFSIVESEAKIILESLIKHESLMAEICDTSDDEDLIADTGNDLIELRLLLSRLKKEFVSSFGQSVLEFSREPL